MGSNADEKQANGTPTDGGHIPVVEQPLFYPRRLRVVAIGAGFSGLTLAYKFKNEFKLDDVADLTIYEKNSDVGGTWLENRYPGVACDVPAHVYTFIFEPNPDWSEFYASGPEIWDYVKRTTKKYNLDEHVQFNSTIIETIWDEASGIWRIKVQQGNSVVDDEADVLVNCTGFLNKWVWPEIKGLHDFKGHKLHSAHWDPTTDCSGKRVALIGNGSSGIQILPKMQKHAAHVTTYIRSPTWISTNFADQFTPDGANFKYSEEQKEEFRKSPEKLRQYRLDIESALNSYFFGFQKESDVQKMLRGAFENTMRKRLGNDAKLCANLIPNWHVGCRRLTPGDGYLESMKADNVSVEFNSIERVTPSGIKTVDGNEEEFDVIICATGFDVTFAPSWRLVGRNGASVDEKWQDDPEAYFGICVPQFPNYFMFSGPNSPLGHGTLTALLDGASNFILRWIHKIAITGLKAVTVREDATQEYNEYTQSLLQRTVWSGGCRSWYKNKKVDGKVTAMYGGSLGHYWRILDSFRVEDFDLDYLHKNRFEFMGNGFTANDLKGEDLAFYLNS